MAEAFRCDICKELFHGEGRRTFLASVPRSEAYCPRPFSVVIEVLDWELVDGSMGAPDLCWTCFYRSVQEALDSYQKGGDV